MSQSSANQLSLFSASSTQSALGLRAWTLISALALCVAAPGVASAQSDWTLGNGNGPGDFNSGGNWSSGVPGSGTTARFDQNGSVSDADARLFQNHTVLQLESNNNSNFDGVLDIGVNLGGAPVPVTLTVNQNVNWRRGNGGTGAKIRIRAGSRLQVGGDMVYGRNGEVLDIQNDGVIEFTTSNGGGPFQWRDRQATPGLMNFGAIEFTGSNTLELGGDIIATSLVISGGGTLDLNGFNLTVTGATTVTNGTILLNDTGVNGADSFTTGSLILNGVNANLNMILSGQIATVNVTGALTLTNGTITQAGGTTPSLNVGSLNMTGGSLILINQATGVTVNGASGALSITGGVVTTAATGGNVDFELTNTGMTLAGTPNLGLVRINDGATVTTSGSFLADTLTVGEGASGSLTIGNLNNVTTTTDFTLAASATMNNGATTGVLVANGTASIVGALTLGPGVPAGADIAGTLTVASSGSIAMGANNMTLAGSLDVSANGASVTGTGVITFDTAGAASITIRNAAATTSLPRIEVAKGLGNTLVLNSTASPAILASSQVTVTSGTFDLRSDTLFGSGGATVINGGTLSSTTGGLTHTFNDGVGAASLTQNSGTFSFTGVGSTLTFQESTTATVTAGNFTVADVTLNDPTPGVAQWNLNVATAATFSGNTLTVVDSNALGGTQTPLVAVATPLANLTNSPGWVPGNRWLGGTADWTLGSNWSSGSPIAAGEVAYFDAISSTGGVPPNNVAGTVAGLVFTSGYADAGFTLTADLVLNGATAGLNLDLTGGADLTTGAFFVVHNGATASITGAGGVAGFGGGGTGGLQLDATTTLTMASGASVNGTLRVNGGTTSVAGIAFAANSIVIEDAGTLNSLANTVQVNADNFTINLTGTYVQNTTGASDTLVSTSLTVSPTAVFTAGTGEVVFDGAATWDGGAINIGNVQVKAGGNTVTVQTSGAVSTNLVVDATDTLSLNAQNLVVTGTLGVAGALTAGANVVTVTGLATVSGSVTNITPTTGTLNFNSGLTVTAGSVTVGGDAVITALTVNGGTLSADGNVTVSGAVTGSGGAIDGGGNLNLNGAVTVSGGIVVTMGVGSTTTFGGTDQTLSVNVGDSFNDVDAADLGATGLTVANDTLTIAGDLTVSTILASGANNIDVAGALSLVATNGSLTTTTGVLTVGGDVTANTLSTLTGGITLDGGGVQFINQNAVNLGAVTLNNALSVATWQDAVLIDSLTATLGSATFGAFPNVINGNVDFSPVGAVNLTLGGTSLSVGGNWDLTNATVFTPGVGAITFSGAGATIAAGGG
ncbi:MAG: hypothetical protein JKY65_29335, partial [Planctomycetes bacterium]|nr:hypothetical protein [Planctomycetota bacterium]